MTSIAKDTVINGLTFTNKNIALSVTTSGVTVDISNSVFESNTQNIVAANGATVNIYSSSFNTIGSLTANKTYTGDTVSIIGTFNDKNLNVANDLILILNGNSYEVTLNNGVLTCDITGLAGGEYSGYLTDTNNNNYNLNNVEFNVLYTSNVVINVEDISVGSSANVIVSVSSDAVVSGNVLVMIDNKYYLLDLSGNSASTTIENMKAGNYTVVAYYNGNNNIKTSFNSANFKVTKQVSETHVSAQNTQPTKNTENYQKIAKNTQLTLKSNSNNTINHTNTNKSLAKTKTNYSIAITNKSVNTSYNSYYQ